MCRPPLPSNYLGNKAHVEEKGSRINSSKEDIPMLE